MPADLLAQILGPLGLVVGCLYAIYQFSTEGWVSGKTMAALRDQNKELLRQNEALQRRLDRAVTVSSRAVEHAEKIDAK